MPKLETCSVCCGTGEVEDTGQRDWPILPLVKCFNCNGKGEIQEGKRADLVQCTKCCVTCEGIGRLKDIQTEDGPIDGGKCQDCNGRCCRYCGGDGMRRILVPDDM